MKGKTIKLVSDTPFFALGLCQTLNNTFSFVSYLQYSNTTTASRKLVSENHTDEDLIIYHCRRREDLTGLRMVLRECKYVPVVAFCCIYTSDIIQISMRRKSVAILDETVDEVEFLKALKKALRGQSYFSRSVGNGILDNLRKKEMLGLTSREVEIISLLASGLKTTAVAAALGISPNTVRNHMANLYEKLAVGNRTAAVVRAMEIGIFRHPTNLNHNE